MSRIESNARILTYLQLCLATLGLWSHEIAPAEGVTRWTSESSDILTWILRVCLGLETNQCTSRNPVKMNWLLGCPREFVVAFLQGVAESDGSVSRTGYYTVIASVPNSTFFHDLLSFIGVPSRVHPKSRPTQLRINLSPAVNLPLFNPLIKSYRFLSMISHAKSRNLIPPSPSFF